MKKELYFAYGSNMDKDQMKNRCPDSKFLKVVYLKDYKFIYDGYSRMWKGSVANIIPKKGAIVWGSLYEISEDDEKRLDRYEGYPNVYNKQKVVVKGEYGNSYEALVYLREPNEKGRPSEKYENQVVNSAKTLGLPVEYIDKYLKVD